MIKAVVDDFGRKIFSESLRKKINNLAQYIIGHRNAPAEGSVT